MALRVQEVSKCLFPKQTFNHNYNYLIQFIAKLLALDFCKFECWKIEGNFDFDVLWFNILLNILLPAKDIYITVRILLFIILHWLMYKAWLAELNLSRNIPLRFLITAIQKRQSITITCI